MKFSISPSDLKKALRGVGATAPKAADVLKLVAHSGHVYIEFNGEAGGQEAVVLSEGGVLLSAQKFVTMLGTFKGSKLITFEGSDEGLEVENLTMKTLRWDPDPGAPLEFHVFPFSDVESAKAFQRTTSTSVNPPGAGDARSVERRHGLSQIPVIDPLPKRISPCPIVEAVVELRFVSSEPWRNLPGLMAPKLRQRYPTEKELPLAQMPEVLRQDAKFTYQPLLQYEGEEFFIRFGPRSLSLLTLTHRYPGWERFRKELKWLWEQAEAAGFVQEGERLGVRYVDFFADDIFPLVNLEVSVAGKELSGLEQSVSMAMPWGKATAKLVLSNGAFLSDGKETRRGSILDLDVWQRLASNNLFAEVGEQVEHLHQGNKALFFGLLRPEFLATLNPEY